MPRRSTNAALLSFLILLALTSRAAAAPIASVTYAVSSEWQSGFQTSVTITNISTTAIINNWALQFTLPYAITSIWNAQIVSKSGNTYVVAGASWDKSIAAASALNFGFIGGAYGGAAPANPTACLLNGQAVSSTTCPSGTTTMRPPSAPTGLKSTARTISSVSLAWSASVPGSFAIGHYNVYKNNVLAGSPATIAFSVTGLGAATTYSFSVAAVDVAGNASAKSAALWVTTSAATAGAYPSRIFAPYVDVTLYPPFPLTASAPSAGKYYTLAFIVDGGNCQAAWGGVIPLSENYMMADINNLRAAGGDVAISFGGQADQELAETCTSAAALQAQYQAVITKYKPARIDFDIEGAAVAQPGSIATRDRVLAALQKVNANLRVSFTLPVLPTGLTSNGVNLVRDALGAGVNINAINVMAMDYGWSDNQLGRDAINAATATAAQLAALLPGKTAAQLRALIGVTPMIGYNDTPGEIFTLTDAQTLLSYALSNGLGMLSMWSETRDQQCATASSWAQPTCSGVAQQPFEFSGIFKKFDP